MCDSDQLKNQMNENASFDLERTLCALTRLNKKKLRDSGVENNLESEPAF